MHTTSIPLKQTAGRSRRPESRPRVTVGFLVLVPVSAAWVAVGVAPSTATSYTNSVYTDGNFKLSVDPNPFGGISPGARPFGASSPSGLGNVGLGLNGLQNLTSGQFNVATRVRQGSRSSNHADLPHHCDRVNDGRAGWQRFSRRRASTRLNWADAARCRATGAPTPKTERLESHKHELGGWV